MQHEKTATQKECNANKVKKVQEKNGKWKTQQKMKRERQGKSAIWEKFNMEKVQHW